MSHLVQYDPKKHINKTPPPTNPETDPFWYVCGAIVLILIVNDILHIATGDGILFHLKHF